jgi:uncharacterized low-complexity protein
VWLLHPRRPADNVPAGRVPQGADHDVIADTVQNLRNSAVLVKPAPASPERGRAVTQRARVQRLRAQPLEEAAALKVAAVPAGVCCGASNRTAVEGRSGEGDCSRHETLAEVLVRLQAIGAQLDPPEIYESFPE